MAIVIFSLDYVGFGVFICGYFGNRLYIGRFSIKLKIFVLSLKIGLSYMATINRNVSVTSPPPPRPQCPCFSVPYTIQIFLFSSFIWPTSIHLGFPLGSRGWLTMRKMNPNTVMFPQEVSSTSLGLGSFYYQVSFYLYRLLSSLPAKTFNNWLLCFLNFEQMWILANFFLPQPGLWVPLLQ